MPKKKTDQPAGTGPTKNAWGQPSAEHEVDSLEGLIGLDPYTASSDARGHNVNIGLRVPPDVARLIAEQIESGKTPYRTASDWVRDAINVHLIITRLRYFKDTPETAVWRRRQELWKVASTAQARTLVSAEAETFADSLRTLVSQDDEQGAAEALASLAIILCEEEDWVIAQYARVLKDCPPVLRLVEHLDGKPAKFLWQLMGQSKPQRKRTEHDQPAPASTPAATSKPAGLG